MPSETFTSHALTLVVSEQPATVLVTWQGRSTAREPAEFLIPILTKALDRASELKQPLTLDFRQIEYFNSSTITPVVRMLEEAKRRGASLVIQYDKKLRWQELSFSALQVFHTGDQRIKVMGV
ncbi:MAG TPA: hypothetical protein VLW85_00900 [Myxococcales bacterium]|nr:hypothetical protein [Myxococcales bacterium]